MCSGSLSQVANGGSEWTGQDACGSHATRGSVPSYGIRGGFRLPLQERVGRLVIPWTEEVGALTIQFWEVLRKAPHVLPIVGTKRRWRATVEQMLVIGVRALPLVAILSLCTGLILALQGAMELSRFGAQQFVVEVV